MSNAYEQKLNDFMAKVIAKNPSEVEFHQAVHEVVETIKVYPNPTTEYLYFSSNLYYDFDISIYDMLGKNVLNSKIDSSRQLNVSNLNRGVYILNINNYNTSIKFVKN